MSKELNSTMEQYGAALWSYQSGRSLYKSAGDRSLRSNDPDFSAWSLCLLRQRLAKVYQWRKYIKLRYGVELPSIRIPVYGNTNKTWKGENNGTI